MSGLDAHITSGRYREELIEVQCPDCEDWTTVKAISEYGALASAIVSYDPARSATWTRAESRCSARAFGSPPGPFDYSAFSPSGASS